MLLREKSKKIVKYILKKRFRSQFVNTLWEEL